MIYFDNAATSWPKPPEVGRAVMDGIAAFGNASRGAHPFAMAAARAIEDARTRAAALFRCPDPARVVFTKSATEALNIAVNSVRGRIVTTEAEHNSVLRPVFRRGDFSIVPVDGAGCYRVSDIRERCGAGTGAVIVAHGSNLTGFVAPVEEIGAMCRERGILFIVDAAQTAGLFDIDAEGLGIDALCFSGHKSLYGLQGTGGMCLSGRFEPEPLIVGGSGDHTFSPEQPRELPGRLEAGTANAHGLAALAAGIGYVAKCGTRVLLDRANALAERFTEGVRPVRGVRLYGLFDGGERLPIVTLNVGSLDSAEVAAELADDFGIAVRGGAHCVPLLHKRFGTEKQGAVRFSFSHLNDEAEVDAAIRALHEIAGR